VPAKPASSTPPADLRLDLEDRKYLRAVVFDSNAFGVARPDLAFLEDLAQRLHGIKIETWVPEPVAWEWAQHLAEDWHNVQTAMADERRRLKRAGLTGHSSPYKDARAVVDAFLARLDAVPHLTVIPLSPQNALLAVKDQILLIPPGRLKDKVKTGASDSAWLRAVLDQVDGDIGRLLLVSEDKDIKAAFKEWGKADPLMRKRVELKATMLEFTVDEGDAEDLIRQYLTTSLSDPSQGEDTLGFDIDAASNLENLIASSFAEDEPDTGLYGASLARLTGLAGITDTYIEPALAAQADHPQTNELGPASTQTALATVFFLADAEATVNRLYNGGDPHVDDLNYDDVLVRVEHDEAVSQLTARLRLVHEQAEIAAAEAAHAESRLRAVEHEIHAGGGSADHEVRIAVRARISEVNVRRDAWHEEESQIADALRTFERNRELRRASRGSLERANRLLSDLQAIDSASTRKE